MKIPKIVFAVAALHMGVIAVLFVQPGCQSSQTIAASGEAATVQAESQQSIMAEAASAETVVMESDDGFSDETIAEVQVNRLPPTRPEIKEAYGAPLVSDASISPVSARVAEEPLVEEEPELAVNTYLIQSGDSLWKIANMHGTTVAAIQAENGLSKNAVIHPGKELRIPSGASPAPRAVNESRGTAPAVVSQGVSNSRNLEVYYVVPGDSLSVIARKFGTTVNAIKEVNGMKTERIFAGQELSLPSDIKASAMRAPEPKVANSGQDLVHRVKKGETLGGIARRYGVPVPELMELNAVSNPRTIAVGQKIIVKRGTTALPADPAAVRIKPVSGDSAVFGELFSDPDSIPVVPVESDSTRN